MKQKCGDREQDQYPILQQGGEACGLGRFLARDCATGLRIVDLMAVDGSQCDQRRYCQNDGGIEDGAIAEAVTEVRNDESGDDVACGVERLVSTELAIEVSATDNSEGNGRYTGCEKWRCTADEQLCGIDKWGVRAEEQERGSNDERTQTDGNEEPLAMGSVNGRPCGSLQGYGHKAAKGEGIADACRIPAGRSENSCKKWAQARLYVGEKEVEPFNGAEAALPGLVGICQSHL